MSSTCWLQMEQEVFTCLLLLQAGCEIRAGLWSKHEACTSHNGNGIQMWLRPTKASDESSKWVPCTCALPRWGPLPAPSLSQYCSAFPPINYHVKRLKCFLYSSLHIVGALLTFIHLHSSDGSDLKALDMWCSWGDDGWGGNLLIEEWAHHSWEADMAVKKEPVRGTAAEC